MIRRIGAALTGKFANYVSLSILGVLGSLGVSPPAAASEASEQIWANVILARPVSEKLYLEYDFEGAKQVSGGVPWGSLYGTALVEFYPNDWFDLTGELVTGLTRENKEIDSSELTTRLGLRFHLITQIFNSPFVTKIRPERMSGKKFNIAILARIEQRNFWYSDDSLSTSDARFRTRLETKLALNSPTLSKDGVWYLIADAEWFTPLTDEEAPERFTTKRRMRLGLGFRHSYKWRFDILAMKDITRESPYSEIKEDAKIIDFRVKYFF